MKFPEWWNREVLTKESGGTRWRKESGSDVSRPSRFLHQSWGFCSSDRCFWRNNSGKRWFIPFWLLQIYRGSFSSWLFVRQSTFRGCTRCFQFFRRHWSFHISSFSWWDFSRHFVAIWISPSPFALAWTLILRSAFYPPISNIVISFPTLLLRWCPFCTRVYNNFPGIYFCSSCFRGRTPLRNQIYISLNLFSKFVVLSRSGSYKSRRFGRPACGPWPLLASSACWGRHCDSSSFCLVRWWMLGISSWRGSTSNSIRWCKLPSSSLRCGW